MTRVTARRPTSWIVEIDEHLLVPAESEQEAVETWLKGEFELGISIVIYRGY